MPRRLHDSYHPQELKGPFPRRLIQKAVFREQYFDETMTYFLETTPDPLDNTRVRSIPKQLADLVRLSSRRLE